VNYQVRLSNRATRDLDHLSRNTRDRVLKRLDQLAEDPRDPRFSAPLAGKGGLRKSRVGGWRIIFSVEEAVKVVAVVTIDRRGQVYHRV
jgi:mRNA interferase RelE/StbE